ncbi:AfsR/SARP family transcriptional regulator [Chloroflexus sp.]|uniref:AfsR/SARP family transcriptional regulator n=1 Tax=Chloroflexus sp. TaxID=1904827 RepID=UPI00298F26FE|nr:BTAD domain-containing putative transcriptional regulator [Chloroflexus sp.]MDW8405199.1 BTAD domain-containing putative transcriptional regulator [Chloroflexus sp.]
MSNPVTLYLPLLTHTDPEVRRQATTILLTHYGNRALTYLRRLLDDAEFSEQARAALTHIGDITGLRIELRPFRGVYVRCLGDFQVFIDSRLIKPEEWGQSEGGRAGGRKVQGIFAYLVHCGETGATRSEIANAIWGGAASASSIARTLTALRQVLHHCGGTELATNLLHTDRQRCALNTDLYRSDADLLERTFDLAVKTGEEQGLEAAQSFYQYVLDLYDGPYMEGIAGAQQWAAERRASLLSKTVLSGERLAAHAYATGNDQQCLQYCQRVLALEPQAAAVVNWHLRASHRLGLPVEMQRAYQRYLAAAGINPRRKRDDPVVQLYHELTE